MFALQSQGPYAPNAETQGTDAIWYESTVFKSWASQVTLERGYKDIADKSLGLVNFGVPEDAIGMSDRAAVSLGDSGVITLSFEGWLLNGPGADFAVFENSFNHEFLELAFVEVSKDGIHYQRFPAYSETPASTQISSFDLLDATNLKNLAGKYKVQYGTPYDLNEVGIDSIKYIRVVDVIGSIDSNIASRDANGRIINDPYPTDFQNNGFYTGGFDLEAVGLINYEGTIFLSQSPIASLRQHVKVYPNPVKSSLTVQTAQESQITIRDMSGKVWLAVHTSQNQNRIDVSQMNRGIYQVSVQNENEHFVTKLLVQ